MTESPETDAIIKARSVGKYGQIIALCRIFEREVKAWRAHFPTDAEPGIVYEVAKRKIPQLQAELTEARAEAAALRLQMDTKVADFLNEKVCCNGQDCGCMGVTRLQQIVHEECGIKLEELRDKIALAMKHEVNMTAHVIELEKDRARLTFLESGYRAISWFDRVQKWVVQGHNQVCGNIGAAARLRDAIDAAMKTNP